MSSRIQMLFLITITEETMPTAEEKMTPEEQIESLLGDIRLCTNDINEKELQILETENFLKLANRSLPALQIHLDKLRKELLEQQIRVHLLNQLVNRIT